MSALDAAREYCDRGWAPIPVPHGAKAPVLKQWQDLRIHADELPRHFNGKPLNIGILNGGPSSGRVDIDLDAPEALALSDVFLPPTRSIFGRASKPRSHWGYRLDPLLSTEQFRDPDVGDDDSAMLVEIRSTGTHTLAPPSEHPLGEVVTWDDDGEPATIAASELRQAVTRLATAALLARHWPAYGQRHAGALAAGGFLITGGVPPAIAGQIVEYAAHAARDQDWRTRGRDVRDTANTIANNEPVTGGPTLASLLRGDGDKVIAEISKWLGLRPVGRRAEGIDAGDRDLPRVTAAAWAALQAANEPPRLFRHGDVPVRLEHDEEGRPVLTPLTRERLRHELARATSWFVSTKKGGVKAAAPPLIVTEDMLAGSDVPLPPLRAISYTPVFTSNGTLLLNPGYYRDAGILVVVPDDLVIPDVPEHPGGRDIALAKTLIEHELLGDFPFVSDVDRAHAVALLLLPIVRGLIEAATPLHLIDKPSPGTGGGLLADVFGIVSTGRSIAVMTEARDEDEWRKRLIAKLLQSPVAIVIDNVRRRLESAALSAAITAQTFEDRLLGVSRMVHVPVRCVWLATGNNVAVSTEIARRTVRMRMDAKTDRPWLRDTFRHADLRAWATTRRGTLVWALLVLVRTWVAAGRPEGKVVLGSVERWARVIGGILNHVAIPGFLDNAKQFYEDADADGAAWRQFVMAWWDAFSDREVGISDLWSVVVPANGDAIDLGLGELEKDKSVRTKLGRRLGEMHDRQFGDLRIVKGGKRKHAQLWRLVKGERQ